MTTATAKNKTVFSWRPYQEEFIGDRKHVQVRFWCRQSGKDETASFKAVLEGLQGHPGDWLIGSVTQRQADNSHEKAARHARAIARLMCNETEESFSSRIGGKTFTFTRRILELPTGVRIISLPGRDPDAWAGFTANVILTEFALFPNGGHKHWRVVAPIALTNGLDVYVITTPRGKDTKAYELRQNRKGRYSVSVVDIARAVRDGLVLRDEDGAPCSIEQFREIYGDPVGWQSEYLVQETDDLDALLSWAEIEGGYEAYEFALLDLADNRGYDRQLENVFAQRLRPLSGRLTVGWDVARKKDLSVLWFNEEVAGRQFLRLLIIMRRCTFAFQREGILEQAMESLPGLCGRGDSTGLGMESNERLEQKYGLFRWQGMNFSGSKVALASRLKNTWQDKRQVIPVSADMVAMDMHGLQKERRGDRLIIHETSNAIEPDSHCDFAWANALALEAAATNTAEPRVTVL